MSKPVLGLLAGLAILAAAPALLRRMGSRATAPAPQEIVRDAIRHVTGREPFDVTLRSPEGAERWTGEPAPKGAVLFVIHDGGDLGLYGDMTPRKQVEKALARHGYGLVVDSSVYSFVVRR